VDVRKILLGLGLGLLLLLGNGLAVAADFYKGKTAYDSGDFKAALVEVRPLAEQGNADAQYLLGLMYSYGEGVLKNWETALKWNTKSAENGNIRAQYRLGFHYYWGHSDVGWSYDNGDKDKALKWFTKAAEQGWPEAQNKLGSMYANGMGVAENDKLALEWYTKAVGIGDYPHIPAVFNLGVMYEKGEGVLENNKTALKWYVKAAAMDHAQAQHRLGLFYEAGKGVQADIKRAYMWFSIASYNGHKPSSDNKDMVAKKLNTSQLNEAQKMSTNCLESFYTDC